MFISDLRFYITETWIYYAVMFPYLLPDNHPATFYVSIKTIIVDVDYLWKQIVICL